MERFLTKLIFFIVFAFIFLGSGSYVVNWISIVIFIFLFLYYFNKFEWSFLNYKRIDFIAWLLFLSMSVLSFIFTKSIPASFEELTTYFFVFFLYCFFILFPRKLFSKKDFVDITLVIGILLSVLSIFNYSTMLDLNQSGVSLIDHYFGHNHLAALLLLILPLGYYKSITSKRLLYKLVTIFLFISMVLTFGRVAILISVMQLLIIDRHFSMKKLRTRKVTFLFLILIILLIISSISFPELFFENPCQSYFSFKNVVCKSVSDDGRIYYWIQAWSGLKENVLFGTGPGTFFLTNEKYKQLLHLSTPYAHNAYLQFFSELGVLGGSSFLLLVLGMLGMVKKTFKSKHVFPMFIGLIGLLTNVFFDFDFNITSIFVFTFIYFGVLIKSIQGEKVSSKSFLRMQAMMISMALFLLITSTMFFSDRFIVKQKGIKFEKNVFLFNSFKSYYFQKYSYETLYPYFSQDYEFLVHFYRNGENNNEEAFDKIRKTSNMSRFYFHDFELFKKLGKTDIYKKDILDSLQLIKTLENDANSHFFIQRKYLIEQFMLLYPPEIVSDFTNFYELVQTVNSEYPWLHYKISYDKFDHYSRSCTLTNELQNNIGEPFGDQRIAVANIYLHCLAYCNRSLDSNGNTPCGLREQIIKNYFEYTHNDRQKLLEELDIILFEFQNDHVVTHEETLFFQSTRNIIEDLE